MWVECADMRKSCWNTWNSDWDNVFFASQISLRGSLMEQMKVLFLAPQPLCTPQGYDDIYQG